MRLSEHTNFESVRPQQIDASAGVIRDVRILGADSKRGRHYSEGARDDAVRLYNHVGVFLNHNPETDPGRNREVLTESFGELQNIRHDRDTSAVYADHHFPTKHPFAPVYIEHAQRFPLQLGFSHNADGEYAAEEKDGQPVVESLSFVTSVDLVDRAATNRGLFESEPMKTFRRKRNLREVNGEYEEPLIDAPVDAVAGPPIDAPVEPEAEPEAAKESGLKAALRTAIMEIFDDESIDHNDTRARIMALLKAGEKMEKEIDTNGVGGELPAEAPEGETEEEEVPVELESLRYMIATLKEGQKARNRQDSVREELAAKHRHASPDQIKALCKLDANSRKTMIESLPTTGDVQRPTRSRARFNESIGELPKTTDGKSFASAMR